MFATRAVAARHVVTLGVRDLFRSSDDTPVWRVTGAMRTPWATSEATNSPVKGRPALGISALPASRANTVW